jgi:FAD/FMN-containing dehydrogenase/Fe-S oxidoreductase
MSVEPANSSQLLKSLSTELDADVFVDTFHCSLYATDASLYAIQPLAVVVPRSVEAVRRTVELARDFDTPVIARGSGTSLSGQSIGRGIVVDFSKYLNGILAIDPEQMTARIQPGVVLDVLNAACAKHGLQFGPEVATSSRANIGGMIGNNSAGARSILHGKVVDHVIALDVVLADGSMIRCAPTTAAERRAKAATQSTEGCIYRELDRIVRENHDEIVARFPALLRRVSGYNLDEFVPESLARMPRAPNAARSREFVAKQYPTADWNLARLIVGAEGTLGCVTEALVNLVPLPPHRSVVVVEFDSLTDSVGTVNAMLAHHPSAIEMFDGMILRLAENNLEYRRKLSFVQGKPESMLIAEFSGSTADEVREPAERLAAEMRAWPGVTHVLIASDRETYQHIWACRKAAMPLLMSIPGARKPITFVEDTAVDPTRLPEFVARFRKILQQHGTDGAFYGHASVGCLHIRPLLDSANRDDIERIEKIAVEIADLVIEFGGAMSGEHGDGLARSFLNEKLFGPKIYRAFQELKGAFDPKNLMNPGKIVDAPRCVENLRYGETYQTLPLVTTLDFKREGGFAAAVEMCNGAGVCRKTQTGTMCPSFMATGDEEHSTRGRANALRQVLSGNLPPDELTGEKMFGTFALCLQCKGCKAECPSNVDVAKMKIEFLDHYWRRHGAPLGVRLMGSVDRLNRWGSALAPVSNWLNRLPGAAWLREKLLGIDRRRPLPEFQRDHFAAWFDARTQRSNAPRGPIVLLDDCLTSYCEPNVNRAAVRVLEAAGYEVHRAGLSCCGRAMMSKGLLGQAKQLVAENVSKLFPWAERGVPIVGCEPSCVLTLTDEYLDLLPGDATRKIAAQARLIDSHLIRERIELPLRPTSEPPAPVLLHGHCYQKALVGTGECRSALELVPGTKVSVLDSGCCGMAGSFGYEHYDVSMQIGSRVLFPAVKAQPGATVIAPGFSCRHQIEHGTGRQALHPIEYLASRLDSDVK